ncbi:MAG: hypothetical protein VB133_07565 [Anaeromusa sp.]|uniref:hypothetical protein n=1 Tax=Anaeromusa sp. TaxID=1872520 RepID=UPI002B1FB1FA|nr:hypothetical protein [Anaeromusa sp.]MEA4834974.1 hypothetical protein [Anaeromusa sp.]
MNESNIDIQLRLNFKPKGVPYGAVERSDSTNHGFKELKGNAAAAERIAEVQDNEALKKALVNINRIDTPFFTVGCEKSLNREITNDRYWMKGFIEFAFNYADIVDNAQHYFKLFYEFNKVVAETKYDLPIQFVWEIEAAHFSKINTGGFTATVWITTMDNPERKEIEDMWGAGVSYLANFLSNYPTGNYRSIY